MRLLLLALIFTLIFPESAQAQKQELVTGEFSGITFKEFVTRIESQTDYHVFYKPVWTDSLSINFSVDQKKINEVFDLLLKDTDLHYAISDHNIYITKDRQLFAELPLDFFNENKNNNGRQSVAFDYSDYEKKEKQKKLTESRLYSIGIRTSNLQGAATLAGIIRDGTTGEPMIGATVFIENPTVGASTDQFGYYSLTLPKGRHELKIKSIGMKSTVRQIMLYSSGKLDVDLEQDITPLKEVVIESKQDSRVSGIQMGMEKLDIRTMRQMPLALGETDIMKVVLTLPGVQSVGEGTVGLNVRGGATNQNLILFNDAVVYNPSHLFGFFSTFNPDVLKNVELYKSGINAEYGGRLSSVLDVHSREGNAKKFSGSGGISPITGRLTLEGPLIKDKTTFIIGARTTYSNWIMRKLDDPSLKSSNASFYDLTGNFTHKINDNNSLYLSGYMSKDRFSLNNDTAYSYSDRNASLKWKHIYNNKLYSVLTISNSNYTYTMSSEKNPVNAFAMDFNVKQLNAKADFSYFLNAKHTFNGGIHATRYDLSPGSLKPEGEKSLIIQDALQEEQGLETALYISDNYDINSKVSVYAGLRYSHYQYLGERDVYNYAKGQPRDESNIVDTVHYAKGKSIANYGGLEPRIAVRYSINENTSMKISYNRMRQYIQMLSNTTAITPTDIWKLSDSHIKPQYGDQVSLGFYKNLKGNLIETSLEVYYKTMNNTVDYKGGAVLLLNHHIETDILSAQGKAYGVEFMVKKSAGKLNGWVSYTYSRSFLKTQGAFSSETVNSGKYYPSNYDKPHAVNFIGNWKFSRRFNFSLNLIYSTGRPITLPTAKYELDGSKRLFYSDRNQFRIPDYFRSDISLNLEGNHKVKKLAHSSWTFAIYNLTGRKNAYSVFFDSKKGTVNGYKLSIFAQPIPTITYNFKF
jgi:hypothetical protein